ncbi:MAG: acetolactate synthase large subunit, partial [Gammaproteobacteria bacterium]|nr:acetolactate synthase large subunit [Gammaproteobacteria bacterium]
GAIVANESITSGGPFGSHSRACPRHTMLSTGGGSIGWALPQATGAAVACPDRPVLALIGDGACMYTNQAFWTQAREGLDVTTVVFNNAKYGILETEYLRLGVNEIGERAADLFDLSRPSIDFVKVAESMGVPGRAVSTAEDFSSALAAAFVEPGPHLIEAML